MATPVGLAVKPLGTPAETAAKVVVTRTDSARAEKAKLQHDADINTDSVHDDPVGKPGDAATVVTRLKAKAVIKNAMVN